MSELHTVPEVITWSLYTFDELSRAALYELLALRQEVFIVGQSCLYLDADGVDLEALHLCGYNGAGELCAYLRAFLSEGRTGEWKVGRVLVREDHRGAGLGERLMREVIAHLSARGARAVHF